MNITKLITNTIVIAGISLTALAESANAQGVGRPRRMATIRELKGHIDLKEMYSNSLAHITKFMR